MKIKLYSILIISLFNIYHAFNADTKFIIELADKLKSFNDNFPEEQVKIQTDKDIYQVGETLWFKAYIMDPLYNNPSSLSKKLFIKLIDEDGNIYSSSIFEIKQALSNGDIIIPNDISKEEIYLIAYTSWMQNGNQIAYIKPITVVKNLLPSLLIDVKFNASTEKYYNNSNIQVSIKDLNGNPLSKAKINYGIIGHNEEYYNGTVSTNEEGISIITIPIDSNKKDDIIKVKLFAKYKKLRDELTYVIPRPALPLEIKFYTEGNNLVSGLNNKIAITVTDSYNNLFDFKGKLYNSKNKEVLSFSSILKGKSLFSFIPDNDKYYIKITEPKISDEKYPLPSVNENGIILTNNGQSNVMAYLNVLKKTAEPEKYYVIAHKKGQILYASISTFTNEGLIKLPVNDLPNGIIQILLFNENQMLIVKRNVIIEHSGIINIEGIEDTNPKSETAIKVIIDKNEKVISSESYSISIVDKNTIYNKSKEQHINSQLNNYANEYYFSYYNNELNKDQKQNIKECLALTNIDLDYDYDGIIDFLNSNLYGYMNLDGYFGRIYNDNNYPISNAKILVVNKESLVSLNLFSDKDGYFYLPYSQYNCKNEDLDLNAVNPGNNQKLIIKNLSDDYSKVFEDAIEKINNYKKSSLLVYSTSNYNVLPIENQNLYSKINFEYENPAKPDETEFKKEIKRDYSSYLSVKEIVREIKHYDITQENKIIFPGYYNSLFAQQGALIVVDGVKYGDDASVLDNISPADVEKVNVSTSVVDVQRYSGLYSNGLIEIFTKRGEFTSTLPLKDRIISTPFKEPNTFKFPVYNSADSPNEDIRTTIYWNPNIEFNENGISEIKYYNADIKTEINGNIFGICPNGAFCNKKFSYKIK